MNRGAKQDAAEEWVVDEDRQLAAACLVDEGGGEGDQEVEEQPSGCCFLSSLECGWAECAAGDPLQEPLEGYALRPDQG
jgi:hypothetical protein